MKLTISTSKLQEMLSRALKCAGESSDRPLTEMLLIKLDGGVLSLTTTDFTNYLVVKESGIEGDAFEAVVRIKTFAPLISKMTSDLITLELKSNYLEVVGNGTYKIDLMLDESGAMQTFPNPNNTMPKDNLVTTISRGLISRILSGLKQSIYNKGTNEPDKPYTKYQVGKTVLASNGYAVSSLNRNVFDTYKAITVDLMNILGVITDDTIDVYANTKLNSANIEIRELAFESEHYSLYGLESPDSAEFPLESLQKWLEKPFKSVCKLPKNAVLQLLGRISLFIEEYDSDTITLNFTKDSLEVSSRALTGVESIKYISSDNHEDFTCLINNKQLEPQIRALEGDVINLYYGDDSAIKLTDAELTTIIAVGE